MVSSDIFHLNDRLYDYLENAGLTLQTAKADFDKRKSARAANANKAAVRRLKMAPHMRSLSAIYSVSLTSLTLLWTGAVVHCAD